MITKNNKAKKPLLTEGTVHRFMKLANISNLSEQFVNNKFGDEEEKKLAQEVRTQNSQRASGTDRLGEAAPPEEAPSIPTDDGSEMPPPDDMGMGEPDGDENGGVGEATIEKLVSAIADVISQQTGVPVSVEGGGEMGGEMPPADDMGMGEEPGAGGEMPPSDVNPEDEEMAEGQSIVAEGANVIEKPKVTNPNEAAQGKVKNSTREAVPGVKAPEEYMTGLGGSKMKDHKMKELEENLVKKILAKVLLEVRKVKENKAKAKPVVAAKPTGTKVPPTTPKKK